MAADGPVTPTLEEMQEGELLEIYQLAKGIFPQLHLCQSCLHIWSHKASDLDDRTKGHLCPKCNCGPYFLGYTTVRDVHDERRILKEARL